MRELSAQFLPKPPRFKQELSIPGFSRRLATFRRIPFNLFGVSLKNPLRKLSSGSSILTSFCVSWVFRLFAQRTIRCFSKRVTFSRTSSLRGFPFFEIFWCFLRGSLTGTVRRFSRFRPASINLNNSKFSRGSFAVSRTLWRFLSRILFARTPRRSNSQAACKKISYNHKLSLPFGIFRRLPSRVFP